MLRAYYFDIYCVHSLKSVKRKTGNSAMKKDAIFMEILVLKNENATPKLFLTDCHCH